MVFEYFFYSNGYKNNITAYLVTYRTGLIFQIVLRQTM